MTKAFFVLMMLTTMTMQAQEHIVLIGTYTNKSSEGIYSYSFNEATRELKKLSVVEAENPSYLTLSSNRKNVYAVIEKGDGKGAVNAYSLDAATGKLTFLNSQPSHGDAPCHVTIDQTDSWVIIANYSGGNFSVYPVEEDGSLGEAVQTIQHTGSSVNKDRQEKAHAHASVLSIDEKHLAVVDLGIDKVMVYPFDAVAEKPVTEQATEVKTKAGAGPRHIVFHRTAPYAYLLEELSGNVTAYSWKNGSLKHIQTISAHPKGFKGTIGSAAIKISDDGRHLYASNRGQSNTIAAFAINSRTGKLSLVGIESTKGDSPRDFTLSPSGKSLLSANANSDSIAIFERAESTGKLSGNPKMVQVPEPVCLVFIDKE